MCLSRPCIRSKFWGVARFFFFFKDRVPLRCPGWPQTVLLQPPELRTVDRCHHTQLWQEYFKGMHSCLKHDHLPSETSHSTYGSRSCCQQAYFLHSDWSHSLRTLREADDLMWMSVAEFHLTPHIEFQIHRGKDLGLRTRQAVHFNLDFHELMLISGSKLVLR